MTICYKIFWGAWPLFPPGYAYVHVNVAKTFFPNLYEREAIAVKAI